MWEINIFHDQYIPYIYVSTHYSQSEKYPNTEFFLVRIFLYSDWVQENTDQEKLRF